MSELIDFSRCPDAHRIYSGSDSKDSILYDGSPYMIKFQEKAEKEIDLQTSYVNNVFSEYIGSHIVASLGIPTQETLLGIYNSNGKEKIVVACKDFCDENHELHPFSWYMLNMYDRSEIRRIPTYRQLYDVIENNPKLAPVRRQAIERYWDTFVADALIGNFDRHKENFGYLVDKKTGKIELAPVYDCGSSLYPNLSIDGMKKVLDAPELIEERIYVFPTAALDMSNDVKVEKKAKYFEMLSSGIDANCTAALKRIYPKINMDKIFAIIDSVSCVPDEKKHFYKTMLAHRKTLILDKAYQIVSEQDKNKEIMRKAEESLFGVKSKNLPVTEKAHGMEI